MSNHIKSGFENDLEPTEFYLSPNYPNPFKKKTKIKYCVAQLTRVILTVFDSEGEQIIKLIDEEKNPGTYEVDFHSKASTRQLIIGNYYYRLEAGDFRTEMKMTLIK